METQSQRPVRIAGVGAGAGNAAKQGFAIVREVATSKYFLRYIVLVVVVAVAVIFYVKNKQ
jgi:hypothetical protein